MTPILAFWLLSGQSGVVEEAADSQALNKASYLPYHLRSCLPPKCRAALWQANLWDASHSRFIPGGLYTSLFPRPPCHQSPLFISKSLNKPMLLIISLSVQTEQPDESFKVLTTGKIAVLNL